MKTTINSRLTVAIMLLGTLLLSGTSLAEIGVVTVDDERIPQAFFHGYASRHESRLCPPKSDSSARETVVMNWLLAREVRRQGIVFEGSAKRHIDSATQKLERLPIDATDERRQKARLELLEEIARYYIDVTVGDIDEATKIDRYRQAIKEGHPKLVNVTLMRRTVYTLADESARDEVQKMIESGRSIAELERENLLGLFDPYQSEEWELMDWFESLHPDQAAGFSAGDVIYPDKYHGPRAIMYVHETKILSRVRPYQPIQGDDGFALRIAFGLVYNERRQKLESSLRKAALVKENNMLVEAVQAWVHPECDK